MAIPTIPTIQEIRDRIISDIESKINQTTPLLPKAFNKVLAGSIAGVFILLYQSILWVYRQIFPQTADIAALELLGALVGISRLPSVFAVLVADIPGSNGYYPPEGTLFRSSNDAVYKITITEIISGGTASVTLTALTSGEVGNLPNDTVLDIINPDANLSGTAEITATNTSGDDAESDDNLRSRVISEYRKRRTGGAPADYESWGLETPNFNWISPLDSPTTPGEVQVYGKVDNQADGVPTGNQLSELYNYLAKNPNTGLRTRHPIGPDVLTLPIERFSFDIEIFIQNSTPSLESQIDNAIADYVETQEPYNEAIHAIKKDTISEGGISNVANGIANPFGATVTNVILKQTSDSLIISSYQLFGGTFGKVNSIIYTAVS